MVCSVDWDLFTYEYLVLAPYMENTYFSNCFWTFVEDQLINCPKLNKGLAALKNSSQLLLVVWNYSFIIKLYQAIE